MVTQIMHKNSIPSSQSTHRVSVVKTNQSVLSMLCG